MTDTEKFDLTQHWADFAEDFAVHLLDPKLVTGSSGSNIRFNTQCPLSDVFQYKMGRELLNIVRTHGAMVFIHGLPEMPHDTGYDIWAITVSSTKVDVEVVLPKGRKMHKLGRKTAKFNKVVSESDNWDGIRSLNLPVEVRFSSG